MRISIAITFVLGKSIPKTLRYALFVLRIITTNDLLFLFQGLVATSVQSIEISRLPEYDNEENLSFLSETDGISSTHAVSSHLYNLYD